MANEQTHLERRPKGVPTPIKIAGLFVISFLLVFILGWIYDLFAEEAQSQQIQSAPTGNQTVLAVDPLIEKELAKVLSFEDSAELGADLKDPFADRSNLAGTAPAQFASLPSRGSLSGATSSGAQASRTGSSGSSPGASTGTNAKPEEVKINIAEETASALAAREARIRAGFDPGPESAIFFIDDLLPVGMVSGGDAPPEVLMYSISMERTYSFPAGAAFRDGWLATWRSDGVAFGDATRGGAIFLKPWTSSVKGDEGSRKVVIDSVPKSGSTD